jgi:phage tail tape-measure protein
MRAKDEIKDPEQLRKEARNEDPISGQSGAHPAGAGIGAAAGGAVAGTAGGAVAGPVGAAVGAVVGGVTGGLAGKAMGEKLDPTVELAYWREAYPARPYYSASVPFETYEPAYRYGITSATSYADRSFTDMESDLEEGWDDPSMEWERAHPAVRDAYERVRRGGSRSKATP